MPVHEFIDPAFAIRLVPARKWVEIDMLGHWDAITLQRFDRELRRVLPILPAERCAIGKQVTLIDMTGYAVQSQDVLGLLAGMAADRTIGSRRIAVLLSSALVKMQARRIAPGYGLFDSRRDAVAWLGQADG